MGFSSPVRYRHPVLTLWYPPLSVIPTYDQTKWMTVDSRIYSTWNPAGPFRGVVTATDGGSCAVGHHEFLALAP
jgi:hypothetical protein